MPTAWVRPLFLIAAAYDFVLGIAFLIAAPYFYRILEITPPNHWGYVQFGAGVVATFGIGFWFVARHPARNIDIIKMGVLLKLTYSLTVFYHQLFGTIPGIWVPFAWFDAAFLVAFLFALPAIQKLPRG
ncbi:MAG: hypothetical protein GHCLOJNM_00545 [bacterium]|nr:hypothetical protein [bacterium]